MLRRVPGALAQCWRPHGFLHLHLRLHLCLGLLLAMAMPGLVVAQASAPLQGAPPRLPEVQLAPEDRFEMLGPPPVIVVGVDAAWVAPQAHVVPPRNPWPRTHLRPPNQSLPAQA